MRPLIVRFAAFGDLVLLTSLIEVLFRRYGERVDLLCNGAWTSDLLASDPRVGDVQVIGSRKSAYVVTPAQWRAVRWLRRRPAGPVYLCESDAKSSWFLKKACIPEDRVLRAMDFPANEPLQFSQWWEQIGKLTPRGIVAQVSEERQLDCAPRLYVSDQDRADCAQWVAARGWLGKPLVLIQPGNKRTLKRGRIAAVTGDNKHWPAQRWVQVIQAVLAIHATAQVLLCGAPAEAGVLRRIAALAGSPRVHNLATALPVRRLLPLLELAIGMISVDTGPAHAAAALECPLVVMFGEQDQRVWRPRSRQAQVIAIGGAAGGASKVLDISVEEVVSAWKRLEKPRTASLS